MSGRDPDRLARIVLNALARSGQRGVLATGWGGLVAGGEKLSFTAFVLSCVGQAVAADQQLAARRIGRNKLAVFDAVDVNTLFEVEEGGRRIIRPHILRAVDRKGICDIHAEIRAFQARSGRGREADFVRWFVRLPGFVRRLALRFMLQSPRRFRALNGTVALSAIGMFGEAGGWGIPVASHTLQLTLGGIAQRPALIDGALVNRELLCVTITIDHDVVDGAPAARFVQRLRELMEQGYGLSGLHLTD